MFGVSTQYYKTGFEGLHLQRLAFSTSSDGVVPLFEPAVKAKVSMPNIQSLIIPIYTADKQQTG